MAKTKTKKTKTEKDFRPGDTVRVYLNIKEGDRQRVGFFEGEVIARRGSGKSATFTVRKIGADRVGVERIFPLESPKIDHIEIKKRGQTRRAKRYYRRNMSK